MLDHSDFDSHHLLYSYSPLSCAKQLQEQQKKDSCVKSLNSTQDHLQMKLCALQDTLDTMKRRLYEKKSKQRKVLTDEELKQKRLEDEIQDLNEWIRELDEERKIAEANERVVKEKYIDAVTLAQTRLHQWGKERDKRRDAQDKIAEQAKEAKRHQKKIEEQDKAAQKQQEMYAQLLEELKVVSADKIRSMQKEWDDEQAARRHGGKW